MKINIKDNSTSTEIKYPCLMVSDDMVYYFVNENTGVNLSEGLWSNNYTVSKFKPFTGTIELSND